MKQRKGGLNYGKNKTMNEKNSKRESFKKEILKTFKFLENEFKFELFKIDDQEDGIYVYYINKTIAIRISLVERDGGIFIDLMRLIRNQIPHEPIFIRKSTVLNVFDFEDLLSVRSPNTRIERPSIDDLVFNYGYMKVFRKVLKQYADGVKEYAGDVLRGDLTIFKKLEKIVKSR